MQIPLQICRYWYGRTYVHTAAFEIRNSKVRIPHFRKFRIRNFLSPFRCFALKYFTYTVRVSKTITDVKVTKSLSIPSKYSSAALRIFKLIRVTPKALLAYLGWT
jgi:hypothetical protein